MLFQVVNIAAVNSYCVFCFTLSYFGWLSTESVLLHLPGKSLLQYEMSEIFTQCKGYGLICALVGSFTFLHYVERRN